MIILVRVRNVLQARCRLPGYEKGWFEVDSVNYGVSNSRPGTDSKSKARGLASLNELTISKTADGATPELMFECCQGVTNHSVEVQMVETAKGGKANFPFLMLRFEDTFVSQWTLGLSTAGTTETVDFDYKRLAIVYYRTKDGFDYESVGVKGWDTSISVEGVPGTSWSYNFKPRGDAKLGSDLPSGKDPGG